jgi:hypothetical protein
MSDAASRGTRVKWIAFATVGGVLLGCLILRKHFHDKEHRLTHTNPNVKRITLEIDKMGSVPLMPSELVVGSNTVSLHGIYEPGGIDLEVEPARNSIVDRNVVTMADIHSKLSDLERNARSDSATSRVFAIEVEDLRDNKEELQGVTIDFGQHNGGTVARSGFAVFTRQHSSVDPADLFLTGAHELTHIFNIHHNDWEPGENRKYDARTTIEGNSQPNTVLWRLSASSIRHLKEHRSEEVWPSRASLSLGTITSAHCEGHQKTNPKQQYDIVDSETLAPLSGHCQDDSSPLMPTVSLEPTKNNAGGLSNNLSLQLEIPKKSFVIGDPVVVTVGLHNVGGQKEEVNPLLNPMFGFLDIEIKSPDADSFRPFLPPIVGDVRNVHLRQLLPGQSLHEEARIFFNARGWSFTTPGTYLMRAEFSLDLEGKRTIVSDIMKINLLAPKTAADKRAAELIMGDEQGLILTMSGGDHLTRGMDSLKEVIAEVPSSAQAPAVRLALGVDALNPPIDSVPGNGGARLKDAERYLVPLLSAHLPPISVVDAEKELAAELWKQGFRDRARKIWELLNKYFAHQESVAALLTDGLRSSPGGELNIGPVAVLPHWSRYTYPLTIPVGARYYVVRKGDTLSGIAARFLGHRSQWRQIHRSNPYVTNPHLIFPGDPLIIEVVVKEKEIKSK